MGGKSSIHSEGFQNVYLPIVRAECPDSDFEHFLSSNHSKVEVECDGTSNISQIPRKLGFLIDKVLLFGKKRFFLKISKSSNFAVE